MWGQMGRGYFYAARPSLAGDCVMAEPSLFPTARDWSPRVAVDMSWLWAGGGMLARDGGSACDLVAPSCPNWSCLSARVESGSNELQWRIFI